jgi:glutathione S-transferase
MGPIFHIAEASAWNAALSAGEYRHSTRGRTLEEVGFIHCARRDQVEQVANALYAGEQGLVLLSIDRGRVGAEVREEHIDGADDLFPHIYGPLNVDAVTRVVPFEPGADGRFVVPE